MLFDCQAILPPSTILESDLIGPVGSSYIPSVIGTGLAGGGLLELPINNNLITLTASPPIQSFTSLYENGSRTFTIELSPEVEQLYWSYTPESDISQTLNPIINQGLNIVNALPFTNGQFSLIENYILEECVGNIGVASVRIDCPEGCPDIERNVPVNASFVNPPMNISISGPQINLPEGLPDGCEQEYEFTYTFNIGQTQAISIHNLTIPIDQSIYTINEIKVAGTDVTDGFTNPISLSGVSSFQVVIKTGFNCEPFKNCSQKSNELHLSPYVEFEYSRDCEEGTNTVNLLLPNSNQGEEFLGTLIGGAQLLDYSNQQNTVPVLYEFMATNLLRFGLSPNNDCDIQYQLVLSTESAEGPVNLSVNNAIGPFNQQVIIPITGLQPEQYTSLDFQLTFENCPWDDLEPNSGPVTLHAEVQAFCPECQDCFRTLRCLDRTIIAHCTGDCTGPIGTKSAPNKPDIKRTTLGWSNEDSYKSGGDALSSLNAPSQIALNQQLKTFYPFDIFEITAYGHADVGQQIGFEIAYPELSGISFEFLEAIITDPLINPNPTPPFNTTGCFTTEILSGTDVFGYDGEVLNKFHIWYNTNCSQPTNFENFKITARVRVLNNLPVGFVENEFRLQFISQGINGQVNTSCDSYGNRLTFLSPGYDFERYQMPITQAGVILNPLSSASPIDPETQFIIKNNPLQFAHETVPNQNVDVCRSTAGVLVSGYGAKGGNSRDFPYEYRPMIDWPATAEMQNLISAKAYPNFNSIYLAPTTIDDPNQTNRFLEPIEASNNLDNLKGVYLELKATDCSNGNIPVVSEDFRFLHHAYVNSSDFELELDESFYVTPFETDINYSTNLNFNINNLLTTPSGPFNGNIYNIPISINQPTVPAGLAQIQNVLVYYFLTYANGDPLEPEDNSSVGEIISYSANDVSAQMNGIISNGFAYYFNSNIVGVNLGQIPVNLSCTSFNYRLNIRLQHFCDEDGLSEFINSGNAPCISIERNILLTPTSPSNLQLDGDSYLQLDNDPITGECYLQWEVTFTNPVGRPEILNPNFIFNTPNGLILLNEAPNQPTLVYSDGNSTPINLNNPVFGLEGLASPFEENLVATFSLSPISSSDFIFDAGSTLTYRVRFKYSYDLCANGTEGYTFLGRLVGRGRCSELEIPLNSVSDGMPPSPEAGSQCCVPVDVAVNAINACPGQNGRIVFTALNNTTLDGATVQLFDTAGPMETQPELTGTVQWISSSLGSYGALVTMPNGNQMSFTVNIENGDISPSFTAQSLTVCANSLFSATVSDSNPLNSAPYNYSWVGPSPSTAVVCTTGSYQTNSPVSGEYSVTITNTTTGCSASHPFAIQVDMPPSQSNAGANQTICSPNTALLATSPLVGTGIWSAASTSSTMFATPSSNTSQVSGLVLGQNILTWTVSNGVCPASSSTTNITVLANPNVNAGPDQSVCGTNATLAANTLQNATWSIVSGSGTFSNLNASNATVTGLSFGQNVFRWTFNNGVCPAASDEVIITAIELPTSADAGLDQQICSTAELIQLSANQPTVGTGTWSGNVTFSNATSNNATIETIPNAGNYTLTWTTSNGICTSIDYMLLTIQDSPQLNAGEDVFTCNNNIVLGATPYYGASWSVPIGSSVSINSPSNAASIADNLDFGDNTFNWSVNDAVCGLVSDEVIVRQVQPPIIDLVIPETMCTTQSFNLIASPAGGVLTINGVEYTNNYSNPIEINGLELGTATVNYTLIGEASCVFTHSETFEVVEGCLCLCPNPINQPIYIPDNVTTGEGIAAFFGTNDIHEKCIYFSQNISIGNTLSFFNCNLTFGPGIEIDIRESGNVKISRSQLHGCKFMWTGIRNLGKLYIESSTVGDAQYAINLIENVNNPNGPNPSTSLNNVELSHNFIGITNEKINDGNKHDTKFRGVDFVGGNLLLNFEGQYPEAHPTNGLSGIKLNNFNSMTNYLVIDISNSFSDLTNGIILNRSLLRIGNTDGSNLSYTPTTMFSNIRSFMGSDQFYSGSDYYFYESFKNSGIIATDKSYVMMIGASASGIDLPQFINAEPEFINCEFGICLNRSGARIMNTTFGSILQPIRRTAVVVEQPSQSYAFSIYQNRIRSLRMGINVRTSTNLNNSGSSISNNNISMLSPISRGIVLANLYSTTQTDGSIPLKVSENTINLLGSPTFFFNANHHGIWAMSSPKLEISGNFIRRKNVTDGTGILGNDITGATISCNEVIGWDVPCEDQNNTMLPNVINKGISLYGCDNCDVINNTTSDTRVGIQFIESNSETVLQQNVMRNHGNSNFRGIGLVFGTNTDPNNLGWIQGNSEIAATFDDQLNSANRWVTPSNSQWMLGAKKPAWYGQNIRLFVNNYNQGQINEFYPSHQPVNPNNCQIDPFFRCLSGSENIVPSDCDAGSTLEGFRLANGNNVISLVEKYLNNQISYDYYEPEMLYAIEKSIDAMLVDSQLTISNDSTGALAEFDAFMEATSTRELNKIQKQIERFRIDSAQFAALVFKQAILDSLSLYISSLHSQLSDSTLTSDSLIWNEISTVVEQVATTKLEVETIQSQFEIDKDELLQNLRAQNNQLVALNLIEYYLKSMNELLFKKLKQDNYVFNESERSLIDQVAANCPIIGGRGVFKARGLQLSYNDSIFHDDKILCEAQGIAYRISDSDTVKFNQEIQERMITYPSPNNGILHILMKSSVESDYHFQLINLTGQVVVDQNNVPSNNTINLASYNLASGSYIISCKQNSTGKFFRNRIFYEN